MPFMAACFIAVGLADLGCPGKREGQEIVEIQYPVGRADKGSRYPEEEPAKEPVFPQ